jgi:hypothetical protein
MRNLILPFTAAFCLAAGTTYALLLYHVAVHAAP